MALADRSNVGVEAVLELSGADREAKAYAFLYAAFKRTEVGINPVRDAVDCLIPFMDPYLNTIAGNQVSVAGMQGYLKKEFGFEIPIYAIEQLLPTLQKHGYIEFNKKVYAYFAKEHESEFDVIKGEIEVEFDDVVARLAVYAQEVGFAVEPPSGSWGDALITFLKTRTDRASLKVVKVKGVLLEPQKVETAVVGAFIAKLYESNPVAFSKLVNIFMGVLVEEFISSLSEIGEIDLKSPVHVLYDTAVLLRLLGCSGKFLKTATDELNRYLQELGFRIYYFSGNEAEVAGILDTIVHLKDSGRELEGETADAIAMGDVSMTHIRMLQNSFPDRLAAMNVFSAEALEKNALDNAKYQIDERAFGEYLKQKALANGRNYGQQNRENDARYLGTIMRLRGRNNARDLLGCGYVFATSNKFLAQMSRRFLIEHKVIQPQHCPPILSVGQIATIAWLMKDKALEPEKAGRELLSNCFAAVRPDHEWFKYFREGIEQIKGNIEEYGRDARNTLTLKAARRIAQEESFGESALMRGLNMVEILQRAEQESKRVAEERETEIAEEFKKLGEERDSAVQQAFLQAELAERRRHETARLERADRIANSVVNTLRAVGVALFIGITAWALYLQITDQLSVVLWILSALLAVVSVFAFMDLLRIEVAEQALSYLRRKLAYKIAGWLGNSPP